MSDEHTQNSPLSIELRELAKGITAGLQREMAIVQRDISQSTVDIQRHVDAKMETLSRHLEDTRKELKADIGEIKEEIAAQAATLTEHGEELARMSERMKSGDKRFAQIERRLDELAKEEKRDGLKIAKLIGILTAGMLGGAGIGSALMPKHQAPEPVSPPARIEKQ